MSSAPEETEYCTPLFVATKPVPVFGLTAAIGIAAGFALVSLSPGQADSGLNGVYNITGSSE